MTDTAVAWHGLKINIRRYITSVLLSWIVKLTPDEDKHTFLGVVVLLEAMDRDSQNDG